MRVPSPQAVKAHLGRAGYALVLSNQRGRNYQKLVLNDRDGRERGSFDSVASFWAFWMHTAVNVLFEDLCIRRYLADYRRASKRKRERMARDFDKHLSGDSRVLEIYLQPRKQISVDQLPRKWRWMLERNLNGDIAARGFFSYARPGMLKIDPSVEVNLPSRLRDLIG